MTTGLTSNGLDIPTVLEVLKSINDDQATALDPNLNTSPDSPQGQENGIFADAIEQVYEVVQIAYNAFDPDAAEDFLLDALSALTGTLRQPATPSFFDGGNLIWVGLAPNTTIPVGTLFSQLGNLTNQYQTFIAISSPVSAADKVNISSVIANVFTTAAPHGFAIGQAIQIATTGAFPTSVVPGVYYVIATNFGASTFSIALAPGGTIITSSGGSSCTVAPAYSIPLAKCTTPGPIPCNASTLTVIANPIAGLYSVANPASAFLGTAQDTDAQLRFRRESELRASGSGSIPAIQASVEDIEVNGVQPAVNVQIFENTLDAVDPVTGLPGHSFEVLIFDGTTGLIPPAIPAIPNDTIAQAIWDNKPAGIQSFGDSFGAAIDSVGVAHLVHFSRPQTIEITFAITLHMHVAQYDTTNITTKNSVVAALKAHMVPGGLIAFSWFFAAISALPGLDYIESVAINGLPANTDMNSLTLRQYAYTLTTDVIVTAIDNTEVFIS